MQRTSLQLLIGWLALGCTPLPAPAPIPRAASAPVTPLGALPPTKSDGAPYVWRNVNIQGGGFVTGIAFSPAERDLVYARSDLGGAYRYDAKLRVWIPLTDNIGRVDSGLTSIESIAPDPRDANKVYVAAGAYVAPWAPTGAILRSGDRGATWVRTDMPFRMGGAEAGRSIGERLAVDPHKTDVLFFGSRQSGLWRSADAAVTWTQVEGFPMRSDESGLGVGLVLFDVKSGADGAPTPTLYAGVVSSGGVMVSRDAGQSWRALPSQPDGLVPHHAALATDGKLYLTYANGAGPERLTRGAVYRFDPKTNVFSDITPLAPRDEDHFGYAGLAVDALNPRALLVSTIDRWALGDEIFRSTDGGAHWTPLLARAKRHGAGAEYLRFGKATLAAPGWMGDIEIDPFDSARALAASGRGVWRGEDVTAADRGQSTRWSFNSQGLELTIASRLLSPPTGAALLSGVGDLCGFRHDDLERSPPQGMFTNPLCHTTSGLDYAALRPERVVRVGNAWSESRHGAWSNDGGSSWRPFLREPEGGETGGVVAISADGASVLWVPKRGAAAYTRDLGASWRTASGLPLPEASEFHVPVNLRVAADRVNSNKFYVFDCAAGAVYVSEDRAQHFTPAVRALPVLADWEQTSGAIETMPGVEGEVWLSTGKDVYRSLDSGHSFHALGSVQESYALGFGRAAPDRANLSVFLSGRVRGVTGLFRSDDLGATWIRINDEQHQFGFVSAISGDLKRFGRVYVGTGGRGILYGDPR